METPWREEREVRCGRCRTPTPVRNVTCVARAGSVFDGVDFGLPAGLNTGVWRKIIARLRPPTHDLLRVGERELSLLTVRHPRARRYLLRLLPDGTARVTIPRGGNRGEARAFVERNLGWLEGQLQRQQARPPQRREWHVGTEIRLRGELVRIESAADGRIYIGGVVLCVTSAAADLRPVVEKHLRGLAVAELPFRVKELADRHRFTVARVIVRNQRTRWGSCSRRGTISLNWRLIQTSEFVRDYIILHELAHLRHMNHSHRFWAEVERLCPDYRAAERWLKANRDILR